MKQTISLALAHSTSLTSDVFIYIPSPHLRSASRRGISPRIHYFQRKSDCISEGGKKLREKKIGYFFILFPPLHNIHFRAGRFEFRSARNEPAFCFTMFKIKCCLRMLCTLRNCFVTTAGTRGETCLQWLESGDIFKKLEYKTSGSGNGFSSLWKLERLTSVLELTFAKSMCVEQQDALSVPKRLHTAIAASRIKKIIGKRIWWCRNAWLRCLKHPQSSPQIA